MAKQINKRVDSRIGKQVDMQVNEEERGMRGGRRTQVGGEEREVEMEGEEKEEKGMAVLGSVVYKPSSR